MMNLRNCQIEMDLSKSNANKNYDKASLSSGDCSFVEALHKKTAVPVPAPAKDPASANGDIAEIDDVQADNCYCPCCGKPATLLCTRCRTQRYCSKECQKSHWIKSHKRQCKSLEGRIIFVDLDQDFMEDLISNANGDTSQLQSSSPVPSSPSSMDGSIMISTTSRPREKATTTSTSSLLMDRKFAIKVQVALQGPADHPPMMCYNETRTFRYLIHTGNCTKSRLLEKIIRETGIMDGAKLYFNAKIILRQPLLQPTVSSSGSSKLAIYIDQQLGSLSW